MIHLDETLRARIARAIDDRIAMTVSYIDTRGRPHIAFYGSTHIYSDNQLAIWARNPQGELFRTVPTQPWVSCIYGNIADRVYITFEGRARLAATEEERTRIYEGMPAIEQKFDADRKGVGFIVDLDRVTVLSAATGRQVLE